MKAEIQKSSDLYKILMLDGSDLISLKEGEEVTLDQRVHVRTLNQDTVIVRSDNDDDVIEVDSEKCLSVEHVIYGQEVKIGTLHFTVLKPYQFAKLNKLLDVTSLPKPEEIHSVKKGLPKIFFTALITLFMVNLVALTQEGSSHETSRFIVAETNKAEAKAPEKVQSWKKSAVIPVETKTIKKSLAQVETPKLKPKGKPKPTAKNKRRQFIDEAMVEAAFDPESAKKRLAKAKTKPSLNEEDRDQIDATIQTISRKM